jgi:hypothetical protein
MSTIVNLDNFARAETDRMIAAISGVAGGTNVVFHNRTFASLDAQTVIRENRDTLYTACVVDLSDGATLTLPDPGDRYLSAMVINRDHYINRVIHEAGTHALTVEEHGSDYVVVAIRILVDPNDDADLAAVNALQDQVSIEAGAARPFELPDYDEASFTATRNALLELSKGMPGYAGCFGRREDVHPVRHLVGSASGWGGLPETEAYYVNVQPELPVGEYSLTVGDVPVDAFWSVSLYNGDGFFAPNDLNRNSVNSITAAKNDDGTTTVHFGGTGDHPNTLPIMEGWNYLVRLYRPHPEVLDGTWTFPGID